MLDGEHDYYEAHTDWYEDHRHGGYHELIDDLESDLLRRFVLDREVLEVGCGTGLILQRIEPLADQAIGLDLSEGMLERATRRGLDVVRGDARRLPFDDEAFDVVCSFKMLAHLPDVEQAVREMVRVTRPGGHLLLEFYNPWSIRYLIRYGLGTRALVDDQRGATYTRWDPPIEVRRWLPEEVTLVDFAGIRVVTPGAFIHRIPWVRHWIRKLEFAARDTVLKYFGGFLVAIARKHK